MKFFSNEAEDKLNEQIRAQSVIIREQETTIQRLERKIDEVNNTVKNTNQILHQAANFVDDRRNRICPRVDDKLSHLFIISSISSKNTVHVGIYFISCVQKRSRNSTLKKKETEHNVTLTPIYEIVSPNPIELSGRVSQLYEIDRNYSLIRINCSEKDFITAVSRIVNEEIKEFSTIFNKYI